uniref:Uncharacterized protein n=1 Tax=Blattodean phasma-related virus OKIAV238 TaxID=2746317 RepID=A0A7D7F143_9VIRU|nr:hypothetical protein [Blattodean phasma-related virus OKIAV238]
MNCVLTVNISDDNNISIIKEVGQVRVQSTVYCDCGVFYNYPLILDINRTSFKSYINSHNKVSSNFSIVPPKNICEFNNYIEELSIKLCVNKLELRHIYCIIVETYNNHDSRRNILVHGRCS